MGKKKKRNKSFSLNNMNFKNTNKKDVVSSIVSTVVTDAGIKTEVKTGTKTETKKYGYYSNSKNYDFKGRKNETEYYDFIELCKPTQKELKKILEQKLLNVGYTDVVTGDGYIYAKGTIPILLTAHMDTVHKEPVKDFYEYHDKEKNQHIISSPQGIGGDDRCGIYMILDLIKTHKCSVLFCEDEEVGGKGSDKFCKTELIKELSELKYLIELDRKGNNDAVFYDCDNDNFTKFIEDNTGYKMAWGSFSDISNLSPECKVASVNLSCGYHNAHTTSEYVIIEEMMNTIEVVRKLLDVECEQFEYVEKVYSRNYYNNYNYGYGYGYGYGGYSSNDYYRKANKTHSNYSWYDDYEYELGYQEGYEDGKKAKSSNEEKSMLIMIYSYSKRDTISYVSNGRSEAEAFGNFFMKNPEYCYDDIYDYEMYETRVCDDGWFSA